MSGIPAPPLSDADGAVDRDLALPLSPLQMPIWLSENLCPGTSRWTVVDALRLRGRVNLLALHEAVASTIDRCEVLRTRIDLRNLLPRQSFDARDPRAIRTVSLLGLPAVEREQRHRTILAEETAYCFSLAAEPLFRATIIVLHDADVHLVLTSHHLIVDAESNAIVRRQIAAAYAACVAGTSTPIGAASNTAAAAYRQRLPGPDAAALAPAVAYWTDRLVGVPFSATALYDLPDTPEADDVNPLEFLRIQRHLDENSVIQIERVARAAKVTLFTCFLAALAHAVGSLSGDREQLIGVVTARRDTETAEAVGMFANLMPLGLPTAADSVLGLVRLVTARWQEARPFQIVPFMLLTAHATAGAIPRHLQVLLNFRRTPAAAPALPGLEVQFENYARSYPHCDLTFWVRANNAGGLMLQAMACSTRISASRLSQVLQLVMQFLEVLAQEAGVRESILPG